MKRMPMIFSLIFFAIASSTPAQEGSPPGNADVVIDKDPENQGKVVITIKSVEDPDNGRIRRGRNANDRCAGMSRITWSIQNNSDVTVDVLMTKFYNETTSTDESPFSNEPRGNNIQDGQSRPLAQNMKNSVNTGIYKYHIVVYDQSGNEIGDLDPRIDI